MFTFFFIPETAGKSLEEMDKVFKDVDSAEEEARKARIMNDIVEGKRDTVARV